MLYDVGMQTKKKAGAVPWEMYLVGCPDREQKVETQRG